MHQYTFLPPQSSFSHYQGACQGLHLRFYFSEVHNYKNCLQPQLPTFKCTSRHLGKQWTKEVWQIFRSSCDEGLQQHRIWSFPVLHLHTELDRKAYFPFANAGFPAGAECSAFLPLTNIWKKTCLCFSFAAIRFHCHIPFQCLSIWGTSEA